MTKAALVLLYLALGSQCLRGEDAAPGRKALDQWAETFAVARPWEDLTAMPDSRRRHRGAVAHVLGRLKQGGIPEGALGHFFEDLETLQTIAARGDDEAIGKTRPAFSDYRKFFKIDPFRLWQELLSDSESPERWKSGFTEVYYSKALGTGVPFTVRMPPEIGEQKMYPLMVVIKKGLGVSPGEAFPFIEVKPVGGGIWGYRTMSAADAIGVIDFMKRHYPVDPDRVYLTGFSAGASGAMHLASCHPDEFAAVMPLVAAGSDYPIRVFRNLPVAIHHGTADWTSAICDARVQFQKMKALGCPAILKEYEGVGHSVPQPHAPLMDWLFQRRRDPAPPVLMHDCETLVLGKSRWLRIREFRDPHRRATFEASAEGGMVRIQTENIEAISVDRETAAAAAGDVRVIVVDGKRMEVPEDGKGDIDLRFREGRWQMVDDGNSPKPSGRPYTAGAAANLYEGEPLLIVYGTAIEARTNLLRSAARKLAACGGPTHALLRPPHFPVIADSELSAEQAANCNLILVGRPEENKVTQAILPELPVEIRKGELIAGGREPLPLENRVMGLLHRHPEHPERLVYLLAPFADDEGLARFAEAPHRFLAGSTGFDRVSQADLLVQNLDHEIAREMQFGKDWNWIAMAGADVPIPERFRDRKNLALAYLKVMRGRTGADFTLWWGPADKELWGFDFNYLKRFDPSAYTEADFRTRHRLAETIIGKVSGVEIRDIWNRWGKNGELQTFPEIEIGEVEDDKTYRVHLPTDLYIKLGQRKKNLGDPKPGPLISSEEVRAEIFP